MHGASFFQDHASSQEADASQDVRRHPSRRISGDLAEYIEGKGGEERRADGHQAEGAVPSRAPHELSFQADDESEQARQQDLAKQL
jgi:hypothetical protein